MKTTLLLTALLTLAAFTSSFAAVTGRSADSSIAGTEKLLSDSSGTDTYITVSTLLTTPTITTPVFSGTATGTYTLGGTPTITAPVLSGNITGTYNLGGTATITAPTLSGSVIGTYTLAGTPTIASPVLSGSVTGTYTLAGTPTITAPVFSGTATGTYTLGGTPSITAPVLSGSITGTYTLAGTPTITSPTISGPTITGTTATSGAITQTSASATAFESGPNGGTNPVLRLVNNVASAATGLSITGRAAAAGVDLTVLSSGTNENLVINAKGSGTITLNPTGTGNIVLGRATTTSFGFTQTSASSTAFESGPNGSTNPVFRLVNNISSAATGLSVTGRAAAAGVDLTVLSSGTNEGLVINGKGSGAVLINGTGTGPLNVGDNTTPALSVVHTTEGTGIGITSAAAASGVALAAISSGTNENLTIDAKGSGTITLNGTGTGNIVLGRAATTAYTVTQTSASATAFESGPNGGTNPVFRLVNNVSSAATGLSVTGRAAGAGADLTVLSSGTNENLVINAKGSGTITLNPTATGAVTVNKLLFTELSETVTATNVITAAESGSVFYLNAASEFVSTLPAPAAGLHYTFIVTGAPSGASYTVVTNGSSNIIKGNQNSVAGDAGDFGTADDTISFVDGQSVAGDKVEVFCDGTNWFAYAISKLAAGVTFTQAN